MSSHRWRPSRMIDDDDDDDDADVDHNDDLVSIARLVHVQLTRE